MKELLNKIKPWIKTKIAWLEIALSLVAIVFFIMGLVEYSKYRKGLNVKEDVINIESEGVSAETTEMPEFSQSPESSLKPETTITPEPTGSSTPAPESTNTPTPKATASTVNKVTPKPGPTGAPMYTPVPEESVNTKDKAYRTLIESCQYSKSYSRYYIYDMDGDGTEELIMHVGSDDMDATINIYTYTNEGLVFVGDATGNFAEIYGSTDDGIIVYYRREINGQKYEAIERSLKEGTDCFPSTVVVQAKVSEYTVLEDEEAITAYRLDDFSPF